MRWQSQLFPASIIVSVILVAAACQPSSNPPAVTIPVPTITTGPGTPEATATARTPVIVTPIPSATPAPPGTMAALSQTLLGVAQRMGAAGQVSPVQFQQALDQLTTTAAQISPLINQSQQGTPTVRQRVAQTMEQLSSLATKLRGQASTLSADQRKLALQQTQTLVYQLAQVMVQVQNMPAQSGQSEEQPIMSQLQQVQGSIGYVLIQAGLSTPTPPGPSPTVTPIPAS